MTKQSDTHNTDIRGFDAPTGVVVTKELLASLCKDIQAGEGLPLMYVDETGDYRIITKDFVSQALQSDLIARVEAELPELATETRTLGKDYQGYSRGFNQVVEDIRNTLEKVRKEL